MQAIFSIIIQTSPQSFMPQQAFFGLAKDARACEHGGMQVIIHSSASASDNGFQILDTDWYGHSVQPPLLFRFEKTAEGLLFRAKRNAPALVHPKSECGCFIEGLWEYDTAEFFLSAYTCDRYLEFNLNPVGAWWCRVFGKARVAHADFAGFRPAVRAKGACTPTGWESEALLPHAALAELGINPATCRLATTAVLQSPDSLYLTTAAVRAGEPDFHRPATWEPAFHA